MTISDALNITTKEMESADGALYKSPKEPSEATENIKQKQPASTDCEKLPSGTEQDKTAFTSLYPSTNRTTIEITEIC